MQHDPGHILHTHHTDKTDRRLLPSLRPYPLNRLPKDQRQAPVRTDQRHNKKPALYAAIQSELVKVPFII